MFWFTVEFAKTKQKPEAIWAFLLATLNGFQQLFLQLN